ncbi:MAG: hypothetical protein KBT27_10425 [Prevotellaceae bacterium]|nr:hypothetical protein [Candidatus Faecinaster equi]
MAKQIEKKTQIIADGLIINQLPPEKEGGRWCIVITSVPGQREDSIYCLNHFNKKKTEKELETILQETARIWGEE